MDNWQNIESAPKDGAWVLLEGEFAGGDTSSVRVGRWNPRHFPALDECFDGPAIYEWQVVEDVQVYDSDGAPTFKAPFEWFADGCVMMWAPLPGTDGKVMPAPGEAEESSSHGYAVPYMNGEPVVIDKMQQISYKEEH